MNAFSSPYSTWAEDALREIEEGDARGNRKALVVRSKLQTVFRKFGRFTQGHCAPVILVGFIPLILSAFGLTRAKLETNAENLWIEVGGRLEKELAYTKASLGEGYGGTNELLIQTPNAEGTNILSVKAMKQHLDAVTRATNVTVELFDQTWTLKEICYTLSLPPLEDRMLDTHLPTFLPCVIITPLDCFWEGAKPLGPKEPLRLGDHELGKWTNINPEELIKFLKEKYGNKLSFEGITGLLKEAGITSGYVKRPCLNPYDPECPKTAPNYKTKKKPDIGVELTGGCQGFATKFLDWPEELIVGGIVKNRTGIIRRAEAYQSIIMLLGQQQLYHRWHTKAKVGHIEWSEESASQVLEAWKREFTKTINNIDQSNKDSTVLAFSSTSFNDLLKNFSQTSYAKVAIGYVLMLIYAFLSLKRWSDSVDSHGALGFAGVLLVTVAVASGLGFCSFIGINFNAASTQILPFLALGLGVDDMFLLAHTYSTSKDKTSEPVEHCLASTGVSVFLTSFNNMFAFFMAALIPIPALRSFSLQAAIVVVFNFFAVIVIFPAMIAADNKRRRSGRYDLFCLFQRTDPQRISITPSTSYDGSLMLNRYRSACDSLSDSSAVVQGLNTVILPGSIQATASQTIHLPSVVTVQASALAEVGSTPATQYQHRRGQGRKSKQKPESEDIDLSAAGNVGRGRAGASTNVVQVQLAGSVAAEQKSGKDAKFRPSYQGYNRAFKVHPEKGVNERCTCSSAASPSEQKHKRHATSNMSRDSVVNENASFFSKNLSRDSVINENAVRFISQGESKAWTHSQQRAPRNVQFHVSANASSDGETSVAMAECSSVRESLRTSSSRARSSSGDESIERTSTSESWLGTEEGLSSRWSSVKKKLEVFSLTAFARDYYGPWLQRMPVKIFILFVFACLLAAGVYGSMQVEKGLDLTDVVPRKSPEHKFVEAQFKYFSFYHMFIVTKEGFDYANGQELLYQFHDAFKKIPNIIKTPEGHLPRFWLMYFREWLEGLQHAFDRDWNEGRITYSGWYENASDDGVIAYKLLAQTGEKESINRSMVRSVKLVSEGRIIRPCTFYKYLMVWSSMDYLGYTISQANIKPEPTTEVHWHNIRSKQEYSAMRVEPPAPPINFSYIPFNLNNLRNTQDFIDTIKSVRAISDKFSDKGLPNYPSGVPFIFWEQYIWLGHQLMVAVLIVLAASFVVMAVILCNFWAAVFIVIVLAMITLEVYGFMGLAAIKLSAVPAVTLILSVGVGVEFTVHMCMQFLTSRGDRNQRMQRAVEHVFSPVVYGAVSTLLGVIMLAGSDFDFIVRYFFHLLAALIVIGTMNGLVFLPVLLSLAGPGPEVEEISPPRTASSGGSNREFLPSSSCRQRTHPTDSEICIVESIARQEEKSSGSAARHPRRKKGHHRSNSRGNRRNNPNRCTPTVDSDSSSSTVTRVTARATVTVEVHTEHTSERSSHPNCRGGSQVGKPLHSEGEIDEEDLHITSLEDYGADLKR